MSEEFDVFANAPAPKADASRQAAAAKQKKFRTFKKFTRPGMKQNNSPLRGATGEESVNPLLNPP